MKKLLSILLALSIVCGSVMLTSCSDEEKEDKDDKKSSDRDKDDDDEDEDDEDKDDDDDKSSEDDDESSKDDDESSKDDDESSKDDDDESSKDDESSSEDEPSEDDDESESDYAYLDSFSDEVEVTIFGETSSWPFKAGAFCDYYEVDGNEMTEADDWDWMYDDTTEVDYYNPSIDTETAIKDCYVDYLVTTESADVFEFEVNGVSVGDSLDDINDAFGTDFNVRNGDISIGTNEDYFDYIDFVIEDEKIVEIEVWSTEEYFKSDDETSNSTPDTDTDSMEYQAGDTIQLDGVSFVVPEGFYGEADDTAASLVTSDGMGAIEAEVIEGTDDASQFSEEYFNEQTAAFDADVNNVKYEVSTLGDAETIYYNATISAEGMSMPMTYYIIITDTNCYCFGGYALEADASFMDSIVSSVVLD